MLHAVTIAGLNEVNEILNKFDPLNLIGDDECAKDSNEYDLEAIDIANRAPYIPADKMPEFVKSVFDFWFDNQGITYEMAEAIAEEIYKNVG